MKILLFGSSGQIGTYLHKSLTGLGEINACSRKDCDFNDLNQIKKTTTKYKPNIIVNAAAYTNVDKAESEKQMVKAINVDAVEIIAKAAKNLGALLIDYSSDYILYHICYHQFSHHHHHITGNIVFENKFLTRGQKVLL